ncbi:17226_t:CDS:2 [Funneliformis geosporum]|uniref:17226_t:CDS:1 n=1 Tax=Funneliformis geosporum TaxID=1117311 RepID=A0A9W4SA80_9GLOM|nr:17226_t:CDS:2 [Funneliformis geosporum]
MEQDSAKFNVGYGKCINCSTEQSSVRWCNVCDVKVLKENFGNWTSGNPIIDNFIKFNQLSETGNVEYLEYIDFEQFDFVENTNKGGAFSTISLEGSSMDLG